MKPTTILVAFTAALGFGDVASADCFRTGAKYENKGLTKTQAKRACSGHDGKRGAFQGSYAPHEKKKKCVNISGTQSVKMEVQNKRAEVRNVPDDVCTLRLQTEINNCDKGSTYSKDGWFYRVDPNNERC